MNTLERRFNRIEEKLKVNKKYEGCRLVQVVGIDGKPSIYYCQYPGGRSEIITDSNILKELQDIDGEEITVEIEYKDTKFSVD